MAKQPSVSTVSSGFYSTTTLNDNFTNIQEAFDRFLSLDGETPNSMSADIDLNENDLLNVGDINAATLVLNGTLVTASNALAAADAIDVAIADAGDYFTGIHVEAALQEVGTLIDGVSSNIQTQLETKAPLASPALTGNPTAPTQTEGDASTKLATTAFVDTALSGISSVPVGAILWIAENAVPDGYFECDGAAISRTVYADLFAAIGTTYGVGDGSTTFNVPDLRGEFIRGYDNGRGVDTSRVFGSFQDFAIENIVGTMNGNGGPYGGTGAFDTTSGTRRTGSTTSDSNARFDFDASRVVNTADETRPRNVALLPVIKAFGGVDVSGMADLSALLTAIATQAEAEAGVDNTKLMTPLRTQQAVDDTITYPTGLPVFGINAAGVFQPNNPPVNESLANIASITRTGTGVFDVVFTTAMPNANYIVTFGTTDVNTNSALSIGVVERASRTTTGFTIFNVSEDSGVLDSVDSLSFMVMAVA